MTVIQRDCPVASVCIWRRFFSKSMGGSLHMQSFKRGNIHRKLERIQRMSYKILQPIFSVPHSLHVLQYFRKQKHNKDPLPHFSTTGPNVIQRLLLSFTAAHFLRLRTLSGIVIDHVFVSIHRGQIHHSNLSSYWSAELIMCRRAKKRGQPPVQTHLRFPSFTSAPKEQSKLHWAAGAVRHHG